MQVLSDAVSAAFWPSIRQGKSFSEKKNSISSLLNTNFLENYVV